MYSEIPISSTFQCANGGKVASQISCHTFYVGVVGNVPAAVLAIF